MSDGIDRFEDERDRQRWKTLIGDGGLIGGLHRQGNLQRISGSWLSERPRSFDSCGYRLCVSCSNGLDYTLY